MQIAPSHRSLLWDLVKEAEREVRRSDPAAPLSRVEEDADNAHAEATSRAVAQGAVSYRHEVGPDGRVYVAGAENAAQEAEQPDESGVSPQDADPVDGVSAPEKEESAAREEASDQAKDAGEAASPRGMKASEDEEGDDPEDDPAVQAQVNELKRIEREVIAHEAAHMAVGGQFAGGASYSYTTGPDGKQYIVGGEVPISTPATDDPEEAIRAAQQVMRAALAPANPSGQDFAVAAGAAQTQAQARAELAKQNAAEVAGGTEAEGADGDAAETSTPAESPVAGDDPGRVSRGQAREPERARDAYAATASPNGLWSEGNGFEAREAADLDDLAHAARAAGERFDFAA